MKKGVLGLFDLHIDHSKRRRLDRVSEAHPREQSAQIGSSLWVLEVDVEPGGRVHVHTVLTAKVVQELANKNKR